MFDVTFYRCNECGNIVTVVNKGTCTPTCCGKPMEELVANTTDAATEKHVPVVSVAGDKVVVTVGAVEHPMLEEHSIQWIALATKDRVDLHYLHPGERPVTEFSLDGAEHATVYEYCNLHGLWKAEI